MRRKIVFTVASKSWEGTWTTEAEFDGEDDEQEIAVSAAEKRAGLIPFSKDDLVAITIREIGGERIEPIPVAKSVAGIGTPKKKRRTEGPRRTFH